MYTFKNSTVIFKKISRVLPAFLNFDLFTNALGDHLYVIINSYSKHNFLLCSVLGNHNFRKFFGKPLVIVAQHKL